MNQVINDFEYQLNLEPANLQAYTLGEEELVSTDLLNLNSLILYLSREDKVTINDSSGFKWENSIISLLHYLIYEVHDTGPFLITTPNILVWQKLFDKIPELLVLTYWGSQGGNKTIQQTQIFQDTNQLKFNLLLSTSELSDDDYSYLNENIRFHLWIMQDTDTGKHSLNSAKTIIYQSNLYQKNTQLKSSAKFARDNKELLLKPTIDSFEENELSTAFFQSLDLVSSNVINDSIDKFYLNCPLSEVQNNLFEELLIEYQEKKDMFLFMKQLLQLSCHPFLISGIEHKLGGLNLCEISTKMQVFARIVEEKVRTGHKILVLSQYDGMLDIIEDFAYENQIQFDRLSSDNINYTVSDSLLILHNPLYYQIDFNPQFLDYIVILDQHCYPFIDSIMCGTRSGLKAIYSLHCAMLNESKLAAFCKRLTEFNSDHFQSMHKQESPQNLFQAPIPQEIRDECETLLNSIIYEGLKKPKCPTPEEIISQATKDQTDILSAADFELVNFMEEYATEIFNNLHPTFPESPPIEQWTYRMRDQLIRGLFSFGWNRWNEISHFYGVYCPLEVMIDSSRYILQKMLCWSKYKYRSIVLLIEETESISESLNQLIKDNKINEKIINKSLFDEPSLRSKLQPIIDNLLNRFDTLLYLNKLLDSNEHDFTRIQINRNENDVYPAANWNPNWDLLLLNVIYQNGFNLFDHYTEFSDNYYHYFFSSILHYKLNDRFIYLVETIRDPKGASLSRPYLNTRNRAIEAPQRHVESLIIDKNNSSDDDADDIDMDLSVHWTSLEKKKVFNYLLDKGSETNCEIIRAAVDLKSKTADNIKEYVDNYIRRCKIPQSEGGVKTKTASRVLKRVIAMDQLKAIVDDYPYVFKIAGNWKLLPRQWPREFEQFYLTDIRNKGLTAINSIQASEEFKKLTRGASAPAYLAKTNTLVKRIKALYNIAVDNANAGVNVGALNEIETHKQKSKRKTLGSENSSDAEDGDYFNHSTRKPANQNRSKQKPVITKRALSEETGVTPPPQQVTNVPVRRVSPDGKYSIDDFAFPVNLTATTSIIDIGTIVYDRPLFHNQRYIYPAGFKSSKMFTSVINPSQKANYINEIIDTGKPSPVFRVTMEGTSKVYEGVTPTAPWISILKDIAKIESGRGKAVSGPEAFLLAPLKTTFLIQLLPNSDKCQDYQRKDIPDSVIKSIPKKSNQVTKVRNTQEQVMEISNSIQIEPKQEEVQIISTVTEEITIQNHEEVPQQEENNLNNEPIPENENNGEIKEKIVKEEIVEQVDQKEEIDMQTTVEPNEVDQIEDSENKENQYRDEDVESEQSDDSSEFEDSAGPRKKKAPPTPKRKPPPRRGTRSSPRLSTATAPKEEIQKSKPKEKRLPPPPEKETDPPGQKMEMIQPPPKKEITPKAETAFKRNSKPQPTKRANQRNTKKPVKKEKSVIMKEPTEDEEPESEQSSDSDFTL